MRTIYDDMLAAYDMHTERERRQAMHEADQQVVLAGLYNGGFFDEAAFCGGTCLRIFHSLRRFSKDMDFSLLSQTEVLTFADITSQWWTNSP